MYKACRNKAWRRCFDKFRMFNWLKEHGYRCAESYIDKERFYSDAKNGKIGYPVFVKPAKGSASIAVSNVYDRETVELLYEHEDGLMIQEFLDGQEIGADHMKLILNNLNGIANKKTIGEYDSGIYMMKYNELMVTRDLR